MTQETGPSEHEIPKTDSAGNTVAFPTPEAREINSPSNPAEVDGPGAEIIYPSKFHPVREPDGALSKLSDEALIQKRERNRNYIALRER